MDRNEKQKDRRRRIQSGSTYADGAALRQLIEEVGEKQEAIAGAANCSVKSIGRALNGGPVGKSILRAILKAIKQPELYEQIARSTPPPKSRRAETDHDRCVLQQGRADAILPRGVSPLHNELKVHSEDKPGRWFPKTGPTAADFRNGRVHRPDNLIETVTEKFAESRVVMIEGERATGKSVLARWWAYDWTDGKFEGSYYFDCGLCRGFDAYGLARYIRQSAALFILENMHIEVLKLQELWRELRKAALDSHVLITARSPIITHTKRESLDTLPTVDLTPFAWADEIIRAFAVHAENPDVFGLPRVVSELRTVAKGDYWLLTYALQGCDEKAGSGEPKHWVADGVGDDLSDLELEHCNPRVLLSLAPLYSGEVLTSATFVTEQLGLADAELGELLRRREITRTTCCGHHFYGLPHPTLAAAYWEYGQAYRPKPWDFEEFLYRYITTFPPNGFEALASTPDGVQASLIERLLTDGQLRGVLELAACAELGQWACFGKAFHFPARDLATLVVNMIATHPDLSTVHLWLDLLLVRRCVDGTWLMHLLDKAAVARRITAANNALDRLGVYHLIESVVEAEDALSGEDRVHRIAEGIINCLDPDLMARQLDGEKSATLVAATLAIISRVSRKVAARIWTRRDKLRFQEKLGAITSDATALAGCISELCNAIDGLPADLGEALDWDALAARELRAYSVVGLAELLGSRYDHDEAACRNQWGLTLLANRLSSEADFEDVALCVAGFGRGEHPSIAHTLCKALDLAVLGERMGSSPDRAGANKVIQVIEKVNRPCGLELQRIVSEYWVDPRGQQKLPGLEPW